LRHEKQCSFPMDMHGVNTAGWRAVETPLPGSS
jgi:hypothetical protein